ncbi:hypothetical protein F941_00133 [Acinetobacter bouvetii DSM 14964 = CIP 107468]|uniref:Uncharacterized protein n=1 Tax=Acinetobacter bouvetii DSM 14964 = CIP 107468 TaxID=1120925 RepID=N9CEF9_9GAMM|nr:hypothetical protein [Acinetobacter bouvetii]ENV84217.1 hypothetical protein F941_00133 [Acinetobacter bouvetii DSM 14964 = CIP 107468]BCU66199.1 hypothetical protein ACBO_29900 [Acinetobacter bouvetii]
MIRPLAVLALFLSGIAGYTIDKFGQDLCIYEYISMNSVTYFKELNGVSANDPSMLGMCGLVSIVFSVVLIFIKNKYIYSSLAFFLIVIELILLGMLETASYKEIIYDSITKCLNFSVLGWVVLQAIFIIFSSFYVVKNEKSNAI